MSQITTRTIREMKGKGKKIAALTCYSYSMARILNSVPIDIILVGDSLGMVELGYENTVPVTIQDIIDHTRAVKRARPRALLVADMPFMSTNLSSRETLRNAGRVIKESGAQAVKLEGGRVAAGAVAHLTENGIPVMGHIGLTPQSVHQTGGYRVQGKGGEGLKRLMEEASILEEAGVFALVLEAVPARAAEKITGAISVPTIGIGAGPGCDGQILVLNDMLGMDMEFKPKFVRRYAQLEKEIKTAVNNYIEDVRKGDFPSEGESYRG